MATIDSTFYVSLEQFCQPKPFKGLIYSQKGIEEASVFRLGFEKIKGFFGGVDHTDQKQIRLYTLKFILYGKDRRFVESKEKLQQIKQLAVRASLIPAKKLHRDFVNISSVIDEIANTLPWTMHLFLARNKVFLHPNQVVAKNCQQKPSNPLVRSLDVGNTPSTSSLKDTNQNSAQSSKSVTLLHTDLNHVKKTNIEKMPHSTVSTLPLYKKADDRIPHQSVIDIQVVKPKRFSAKKKHLVSPDEKKESGIPWKKVLALGGFLFLGGCAFGKIYSMNRLAETNCSFPKLEDLYAPLPIQKEICPIVDPYAEFNLSKVISQVVMRGVYSYSASPDFKLYQYSKDCPNEYHCLNDDTQGGFRYQFKAEICDRRDWVVIGQDGSRFSSLHANQNSEGFTFFRNFQPENLGDYSSLKCTKQGEKLFCEGEVVSSIQQKKLFHYKAEEGTDTVSETLSLLNESKEVYTSSDKNVPLLRKFLAASAGVKGSN